MESIAGDYYMLALCMVCVKSTLQYAGGCSLSIWCRKALLTSLTPHTARTAVMSCLSDRNLSRVTVGVVGTLSLQSVLHIGTSLIRFGTMCVGFCQSLCYVYNMYNVSS